MKNIFLIILSAMTVAAHAAPADEFTPQERQALVEIRAKMTASCKGQVDNMLRSALKKDAELLAKTPSVGAWLTDLLGDAEYCTCSMDRVMEKMTPRMFRSGTQAEGEAMGRLAGAECLLPKMKATFPGFCNGLLKDIVKNDTLEAQARAISNICGCVQKDVDAITPETLPLVMKATAVDGQVPQEKQAAQLKTSNSLIASLSRCGLGDLERK
jgi:hypothetical protein